MNNPDNFSLSTDYLHLANDSAGVSSYLTIPANQSVGANAVKTWTTNFDVDTQNGAFVVPYFEVSLPQLSGSKINSYGFSLMFFDSTNGYVPFSVTCGRISNGQFQLKVSMYNNWFGESAKSVSNPEFTVRCGLKSLVVT